ncbi:hypothetical protein Ahia01_000030900, partial [Argonauta hians]
ELKPEFTKTLENIEVKEKEKTLLLCELSKKDAKVIWKKNGKEIQSDNHLKIVADMKVHQIIIENVTLEDIGEYSCVVGDVSTSATLTMKESEARFSKCLSNVSVTEKETAVFSCELSKENISVRWLKNGRDMKKNERFRTITEKFTQTLIIEDVCFEDKGEYICDLGYVSSNATLIVEGKD